MYHEHPIKILRYTAKNLWLLIFPLIRGIKFFPFSTKEIASWISGAWFDLFICGLILMYGILRWYYCGFNYSKQTIRFQCGIFIKKEIEIPCNRITVATIERPFYLIPLKAVILRIHTGSEPDVKLIIHKSQIIKLQYKIPILKIISIPEQQHNLKPLHLFLFSFLFSSSLSGAVYAAAVFVQGGRITRDIFQELQLEELFETITTKASFYFQGIPKIAISLGILILSAWLLSFLLNLFRYYHFKFYCGNDTFSVRMGFLSYRKYYIKRGEVYYADIRQNLIMKLCNMQSIYINCPGYGNFKREFPVLVPLLIKKYTPEFLKALIPDIKISSDKYKCHSSKRAIFMFVWQPLLSIVIIVCIVLFIIPYLYELESILYFFMFMALVPSCWILIIRIVSVFNTEICIDENHIWLHYSKGSIFHTVVASKNRLVKINITQTWFNKRKDLCNVTFYFQGQHKKKHKIIGVSRKEIDNLMEKLTFRK
ncbi:MAG: PH domain-containing protein [Ruminococcus sp.]|nr:PH domain-containing protein [Ruminococcus sp.]